MRVSEQSRLAARQSYLRTASERLESLQQQLATQRRILRASDDPAGAALAIAHRREISFETQMRRNLAGGISFMNATEAALEGVTDALQRVRELTVGAANDPAGSDGRRATAAEIEQLIGQLAQLANTNFGGAYIFSGHKSSTPAYNVTGSPPTDITFEGDAGLRMRRISKHDEVAINVIGSNVFGTMFQDLIALRDNLNGSAPAQAIEASLGDIDSALKSVLDARADVGARINRFEAAERLSEQTDTDLQKLRTEIEDVDITDIVVRFTAAENAFQAALGAIGRTSNMSLLDFLR